MSRETASGSDTSMAVFVDLIPCCYAHVAFAGGDRLHQVFFDKICREFRPCGELSNFDGPKENWIVEG